MGHLLPEVASKVRRLCPDAQLRLYGSRARGEARPDSDWDFLVLVPDLALKGVIRDALYDLELKHGEVLSPLILDQAQWASLEGHLLRQEITRDGKSL